MQYRVITLSMSEGAPARDIGSHKKIVKVLAVRTPDENAFTHQWEVTALVEDSSAELTD